MFCPVKEIEHDKPIALCRRTKGKFLCSRTASPADFSGQKLSKFLIFVTRNATSAGDHFRGKGGKFLIVSGHRLRLRRRSPAIAGPTSRAQLIALSPRRRPPPLANMRRRDSPPRGRPQRPRFVSLSPRVKGFSEETFIPAFALHERRRSRRRKPRAASSSSSS